MQSRALKEQAEIHRCSCREELKTSVLLLKELRLCGNTDLERMRTQFHMCVHCCTCFLQSELSTVSCCWEESACSKQLRCVKEITLQSLQEHCGAVVCADTDMTVSHVHLKSLTYHVTHFRPSLAPPHRPNSHPPSFPRGN